MVEDILEWGESFFGKTHSVSLSCPNDKCERYNNLDYVKEDYHASIAIGVRRYGKDQRPYSLSCECPICFTKFWFHIENGEAEKLSKIHNKK